MKSLYVTLTNVGKSVMLDTCTLLEVPMSLRKSPIPALLAAHWGNAQKSTVSRTAQSKTRARINGLTLASAHFDVNEA